MRDIYLDYQATTPLAPEVLSAMRPWLEEGFANPHSAHRPGRAAAAAVASSRAQIVASLGAEGGSLYFTSGATEAANWAIKSLKCPPSRRRIVTVATEHACVLDTVEFLARGGREIVVLPVGRDGLLDLGRLSEVVDEHTAMVAVMLVNNEIGVVQPIEEIGRMARAAGAVFFCDAVQGFGRVELATEACDMIAVSAHKIHGPKGVGALWVRDGVPLDPLLHGGGQEGGIRSGTLSPALCVGFGEAARLMTVSRSQDRDHVRSLWARVRAMTEEWTLNGSEEQRYCGNVNIRRDGLDVARLMSEVRDVAFSAGSACASGSGRPSHVLAALGLSPAQARSSVRLGFGRYTRAEDLEDGVGRLLEAADRQRRFS